MKRERAAGAAAAAAGDNRNAMFESTTPETMPERECMHLLLTLVKKNIREFRAGSAYVLASCFPIHKYCKNVIHVLVVVASFIWYTSVPATRLHVQGYSQPVSRPGSGMRAQKHIQP